MLIIRKALLSDLPLILHIYDCARKFMRQNGNLTQWPAGYPTQSMLENDIAANRLFVIDDGEEICGAFMFFIGDDPTYSRIENGSWLSSDRYGVIHRVASNGNCHGVMENVINFCESIITHLRIDTHDSNMVMRHILEKNGFTRCGIIHVADGTARIAYEKVGLHLSCLSKSRDKSE